MANWDFVVDKGDLRRTEIVEVPPPELEDGQARLAIERFALTSNNITYALFGDEMRYWDFFPAPDGWGRVPVWGFARVEASNHPDLTEGQRFYGYWPMSTHLTVTPRKTRLGFADEATHRQGLSPVYNQYQAVGAASSDEGYQALLKPLFITGFLIEDFLDENDLFGARSVLVTSASAKTAISLAFQLKRRGKARVVGLTSARNRAFVEALGFYDQVVVYEDLATAPIEEPVVLVDFAGDGGLLRAVHERFGDALAFSCLVGGAHWEAERGARDLPGPEPVFFFAPNRIRKRATDWGAGGLDERHDAAWAPFVADAPRWLRIVEGVGPEAVAEAYAAAVEGRSSADEGRVLSPLP